MSPNVGIELFVRVSKPCFIRLRATKGCHSKLERGIYHQGKIAFVRALHKHATNASIEQNMNGLGGGERLATDWPTIRF